MSRRGGKQGRGRRRRADRVRARSAQPGDSRAPKDQDAQPVGRVRPDSKLSSNIRTPPSPPARRRRKTAAMGGPDLPASVIMGSGGNWYSPELSTDFLELPQSLEERRAYYKFFYENEPFVGQAVDLHTELPLSKIRLRKPVARDPRMAVAATRFCERWADEIRLLHRLLEVSHELSLHGEGFVFVEDNNPEPEPDLLYETVQEVQGDGTLQPKMVERPDARQRLAQWMRKNYRGWTDMYVLPAEQVRMEGFSFTKAKIMELVPDARTKSVIERAQQGDPQAQEIVATMPQDMVERIVRGENLPLNTDPAAGSFVAYLARRRNSYDQRGTSILQRCLRTLIFRDKLRQAQTSIASRHMTPYRIVWADALSIPQLEDLRLQVDQALQDPDFSLVTNFQVNWEEKGGGQENRLLELTSEYDITDRQLYAGLGVTESLLSGESSYSGDRINLEVLNVRFLLIREVLADFINFEVLKPMCARMGFVELDEDGSEVVIFPRVSFTRLALRDNQEVFETLFNLYQKGSLDVETIYELLNIDPDTVQERLKRDLFTLNDATFNELLRGVYTALAEKILNGTEVAKRVASSLGLRYTPPPEPEEEPQGRF